jgi:hypothetical protein
LWCALTEDRAAIEGSPDTYAHQVLINLSRDRRRRLTRRAREIIGADPPVAMVDDLTGTAAAPAYIKGGRALGSGAYDTKVYNHPRRVIMVVPDGVAKVALWYPTGSIANHPKHPITPGSKPVVATVHNNIAAFIAPRRFERPHHEPFSEVGQEIRYGPDGNVVKRIDNANSCGPPLGGCS